MLTPESLHRAGRVKRPLISPESVTSLTGVLTFRSFLALAGTFAGLTVFHFVPLFLSGAGPGGLSLVLMATSATEVTAA